MKKRTRAEDILIQRDGMTKQEAREVVNDTLDEVLGAIEDGDFSLAEDIWLNDTGLDLDDLLDTLI